MDNKYLKYSVEDFAQDIKFINWVIKGKDEKEWSDFLTQNPYKSKDIFTAKKIVSMLRFSPKDLDEGDSYEVYKNIEIFYTLHHKSEQTVRLKKFLKYAALIILILSVGSAIPFFYFKKNNIQFSENKVSVSGEYGEAKLITSSGKEIILKRNQSDITLNKTGSQIEIGKDTTISIDSETAQMAELIVPYGKRSNIQLSDGTKVWMNAGSELVFPQKFTGNKRKVFLKGEAYFEVTKNKVNPFIVSTKDMDVRVYGTKFNVCDFNSEDEAEVVLVEGVVGLKENRVMNYFSKEIKLSPNQKAVYNKTNKITNIESNVNVAYYTSWTEGILEFNTESIISVFKQLSRFYNVRFITEPGVELNRKISGKLDLKDSLAIVMKVVSDAAPITFRIDKNKVFVKNKINPLPMR